MGGGTPMLGHAGPLNKQPIAPKPLIIEDVYWKLGNDKIRILPVGKKDVTLCIEAVGDRRGYENFVMIKVDRGAHRDKGSLPPFEKKIEGGKMIGYTIAGDYRFLFEEKNFSYLLD